MFGVQLYAQSNNDYAPPSRGGTWPWWALVINEIPPYPDYKTFDNNLKVLHGPAESSTYREKQVRYDLNKLPVRGALRPSISLILRKIQ
jgi:hypothetical protein